MTCSLEDIRETCDVASVELPSLVDVACKAIAEDPEGDMIGDLEALLLTPPVPSTPRSDDYVSHHKPIATSP